MDWFRLVLICGLYGLAHNIPTLRFLQVNKPKPASLTNYSIFYCMGPVPHKVKQPTVSLNL